MAYDPNWRKNESAVGRYGPDASIVVGADGRRIGRVFVSMREALRNAARIPGASAHRLER